MELQEGFWKQWDIEVLNFQLASLLNIAAVLFLAARSQHFDFAKLLDIASWPIADIYFFMGPISATVFSLLLGDAFSWLLTYDFGTNIEQLMYWTTIGLTVLAQIAGNGSTVFVFGIATLAVLVLIGVFTLLVALIIPAAIVASILLTFIITILIFLGTPVLILVALVAPLIVNPFTIIISSSYGMLVLALLFDSIYMLFSKHEVPVETVQELYEHGPVSNMIAEWEDTLQDYLENQSDWAISDILEGMLEDFWLHLALQVFVVVPAAGHLAIGKVAYILVMFYTFGTRLFSFLSYGSKGQDLLAVTLLILYILLNNFDGIAISWILYLQIAGLFRIFDLSEFIEYLGVADVAFRLVSHSFLEVEGLYWGIFYLVKQLSRGTSGKKTGTGTEEDSLPEVGLSLGDLASAFSFDGLMEPKEEFLEEVTQPVVLILLLALVQVLTWAFEVPFYLELNNRIS